MTAQFVRILKHILPRRKHPRRKKLEAALGIRIYNFALFEKALRHPSAQRNHTHGILQSYERLEFLGDAILGAVVAEYLYDRFPEEMEGFLTDTRSKLVSGTACAKTARDLGLGDFIELNPYMESHGGRKNNSVLADCLESIIGAIHLDSGITHSRNFIHQNILEYVDFQQLITKDDNYKSRLQEYAQARGWPQPEYFVTDTAGPPHDRIFTVHVHVNGNRLGRGQATSKKKAQQQAAHQALKSLTSNRKHFPNRS